MIIPKAVNSAEGGVIATPTSGTPALTSSGTANNRASVDWTAVASEAPVQKTAARKPAFDAGAAGYVNMLRGELNAIPYAWEAKFMAIAGDGPIDIVRAEQIVAQIITSPDFRSAVKAHVEYGHAETISEMIEEARRHGYKGIAEASARADKWIAQLVNDKLMSLPRFILGAYGIHAGLREASRASRAGEAALRAALNTAIAELANTELEQRSAMADIIRQDIERLCGHTVPASIIDSAVQTGSDSARNALLYAVNMGVTTPRATVGPDAAAGVRSLQLPTMSDAKVVSFAGNTWLPVTMRNFAKGGGLGLGDHIRESAYRASTERRPLRFLEITDSVATNAVPFTDQWSVRKFGDYLLCKGGAGQGKFMKWDAPELRATVVTGPVDMTRTWASQHKRSNSDIMMREVAPWLGADPFNNEGWEIVAAYDKRVASGALSVNTGTSHVDTLKRLAAEGKKFDVGVYQQLAWSADRVRLLEALQSVVAVGGEIMVTTESWAPRSIMDRAGVEDIKRFNDTIVIDGKEQPLIQWLAATYPDAFEVRGGAGCCALIVKGTPVPVKLPAMDCVATGATVENEFPQARWSIVG